MQLSLLLQTERLIIRPFVMGDLAAISAVLDEAFSPEPPENRRAWLIWQVLNYPMRQALYQPPYNDYALVLRETDRLIGTVGIVTSYAPFGKLPYFRERSTTPPNPELFTPEMGLFWALGRADLGQGYATEAAQAVVNWLFDNLKLARVVATTEHDNAASIGVMRRLGMLIQTNPDPTPEWFQVVGILENPQA